MPISAAVIFSHAAEVLVQIKGRCAVSEFDVGQPLRHNIEKGGIQTNRCADDRHNNPALRSVV